jgi:flagellar hook-associated protein 3 FlgL
VRISDQTVVNRMLSQIALTQRRLAEAQERVGSGLRIRRPADDPYGASRIMAARSELERNQQYDRNVAVALSDLAATEAALVRFTDVLDRASELAIQAATDSVGAAGRQAIALEVGQLIAAAITAGNSAQSGRYLFAGQLTDTAPFVPDDPNTPTVINYVGNTSNIDREIAKGTRIAVNLTGNRVQALYAALIKFRDDLLADDGAALDVDVGTLETQLDGLLELRSEVGAKMRRVETAQTQLEENKVQVRTMMAQIEQADLAEAIVELQMQETAYQAALGAAGRTLGMSLLQFLR